MIKKASVIGFFVFMLFGAGLLLPSSSYSQDVPQLRVTILNVQRNLLLAPDATRLYIAIHDPTVDPNEAPNRGIKEYIYPSVCDRDPPLRLEHGRSQSLDPLPSFTFNLKEGVDRVIIEFEAIGIKFNEDNVDYSRCPPSNPVIGSPVPRAGGISLIASAIQVGEFVIDALSVDKLYGKGAINLAQENNAWELGRHTAYGAGNFLTLNNPAFELEYCVELINPSSPASGNSDVCNTGPSGPPGQNPTCLSSQNALSLGHKPLPDPNTRFTLSLWSLYSTPDQFNLFNLDVGLWDQNRWIYRPVHQIQRNAWIPIESYPFEVCIDDTANVYYKSAAPVIDDLPSNTNPALQETPEHALREFFSLTNQKDYASAWERLTEDSHNLLFNNVNFFEAAFERNGHTRQVNEVRIMSQTPNSAILRVNITRQSDSGVNTFESDWRLVWDPIRQRWLLDFSS